MDYKKIIIDIVHKHIPTCKIYLFGSRARKTNREGADFDIALDDLVKIDHKKILLIMSDLEDSLLPVFVDVVDLHAVSEKMKIQIKKDGIIWSEKK